MDRGSRRGRGGKWSHKEYNSGMDSGFNDGDSMSYRGKSNPNRHPPGLKGREIGMWYAARHGPANKERKLKADQQKRQFINMDNNQHHRLASLLVSMRSDLLPQPKQSYSDVFDSSASSDSDDEDDNVAATGTGGEPMSEGSGSTGLSKNSASLRPCEYFSSTVKTQFEGAIAIKEEVSETSSDSSEPFGELSKRSNSSTTADFGADQQLSFDNSRPGSSCTRGDDLVNHVTDERMLSDDDDDSYLEALAAVEREHCTQQAIDDCADDCDENDETDDDCACIIKSEGIDDFAECIPDLQSFTSPEICRESTLDKFENLSKDDNLDALLEDQSKSRSHDPRYSAMMDFRRKLPSYQMREKIVSCINQNQVIVISGETGCGKTTQVPQFILDDYIERGCGSLCRIVCTQPRRISAITIAERVATERGESLCNSVGYQIRLEGRVPRKQGSILYCTTGIMLKWLVSDPFLSMTSHVILDEIHERDVLSDFLMIIVRDLALARPDLKIILMSATLNAQQFASYFNDCATLEIPGFTFPVKQYLLEDVLELLQYRTDQMQPQKKQPIYKAFLSSNKRERDMEIEKQYKDWILKLRNYSRSTIDVLLNMPTSSVADVDYNLVTALIEYITLHKPNGAILVFVPGWEQISKLSESLNSLQLFRSARIIPLHSLMPTVNQREVFERPPAGVRKIVIATNIAETSITIDDVVYVIDCGKIKMKNFDPANNITTLLPQWVSKANAKQRSGRAGRVQPGECYHLYTAFHDERFMDYQLPEILRTRLEELCLQIKLLKLGQIKPFVSKAMQPPSNASIDLAIATLIEMNALSSKTEELTALGYHLARMPVDPHIGKMLLFGAIFSCIDPITTIAASLGFRDAFYIPMGREKVADAKRRSLAENSKSDHIMLANAFSGWQRSKSRRTDRQYCWDNFLSASTLMLIDGMKCQFAQLLFEMGFISDASPSSFGSNRNSSNQKLLKTVICAGLYPNVAMIHRHNKRPPRLKTKTETRVLIHPKSVNADECSYPSSWLVYHLKLKTKQASGVKQSIASSLEGYATHWLDGEHGVNFYTMMIFIHDCTPVSPYSLLLFGGDITIRKDQGEDCIIIDDWIVFRSTRRVARLIKELRVELERLLQRHIAHPGVVNWDNRRDNDCVLMNAIVNLITTEEELETVNCRVNVRHSWTTGDAGAGYRAKSTTKRYFN